MIQPDGRASLAARRSYLRRRRGGRAAMVLWLVVGVVVAWLGVIGLVGFSH